MMDEVQNNSHQHCITQYSIAFKFNLWFCSFLPYHLANEAEPPQFNYSVNFRQLVQIFMCFFI